jgi:hypothetical protein
MYKALLNNNNIEEQGNTSISSCPEPSFYCLTIHLHYMELQYAYDTSECVISLP